MFSLANENFALARIFASSPVPMAITLAGEQCLLDVNGAFCKALGYSRDELLGVARISELMDEANYALFLVKTEAEDLAIPFVLSMRKKGGGILLGKCSMAPVTFGGEACYYLTFIDITEIRAAIEAQRNSEMLYRTIVELAPEAVTVTGLDGKIVNINAQAMKLFGSSGETNPIGMTVLDFVTEEEWVRAEGELVKFMFTREPYSSEYQFKRLDGSHFWGEINAKMIPDAKGRPSLILMLVKNIDARKQAEEQLKLLAVSDDLTGLSNRRGFNLAATQELKHAHRNGHGLGLLFLDIDGLKSINDTKGHSQGDQALMSMASILRKSFRDSDIIARWGGDEFVVLALDVPGGCVGRLLERFQDNLALHNSQEGLVCTLGVSVGLAYYDPDSPLELEELVRQADARMYANKSEKKLKREEV